MGFAGRRCEELVEIRFGVLAGGPPSQPFSRRNGALCDSAAHVVEAALRSQARPVPWPATLAHRVLRGMYLGIPRQRSSRAGAERRTVQIRRARPLGRLAAHEVAGQRIALKPRPKQVRKMSTAPRSCH